MCRRFRRLAASPTLLSSGLHAVIESGSRLGERMASLRAWLERYAAGGQLRQLSLSVMQTYDMRAPMSTDEERQAQRAIVELRAGLRAAFAPLPGAAASPVAELRLDIDELALPVIVDDSWLPTLQGLSSLQLGGNGIGCIKAQLAHLTALRHLSLRLGWSARICGAGIDSWQASLPVSLTSLALASIGEDQTLQEVRGAALAPLSELAFCFLPAAHALHCSAAASLCCWPLAGCAGNSHVSG